MKRLCGPRLTIPRQRSCHALSLTSGAVVVALLLVGNCQASTYSLTISANQGSVIKDPDKALYDANEVVRLIPRPAQGYSFRAWSGDLTSRKLVGTIRMTGNKSVTANFGTWDAPTGIPTPPWGITETHLRYGDPEDTYYYAYADDGRAGTPGYAAYKIGPDGPYTHYVDPDDPNATDTGNPYGSVAKPRKSFPVSRFDAGINTIAAGAVVELHGSLTCPGDHYMPTGTADQPVFIRGVCGDEPILYGQVILEGGGSYTIWENLIWDQRNESITSLRLGAHEGALTNLAIRNCEFHNIIDVPTESRQVIRLKHPFAGGDQLKNIIIYGCYFHDSGENRTRDVKGDIVGVSVAQGSENIWILDNVFCRIGGDGIQLSWDYPYDVGIVANHIYIGRNAFHDLYENAVCVKYCRHVICSENTAYHFGPSYSDEPPYHGTTPFRFGIWDGPVTNEREYLWAIGNTVFECDDADGLFYVTSLSSVPVPSNYSYFIGNLVHDCHNSTTGNATAFLQQHVLKSYYLNNTVVNCDKGFVLSGDLDDTHPDEKITFLNNIVSLYSDSPQPNLWLNATDRSYARMELGYNLFCKPGTGALIRRNWTSDYTFAEWQNSFPTEAAYSLEADPAFVDPAAGDCRLQSTSPAIDAGSSLGIVSEVFDTYAQLYGVDIRKDIEGKLRTGAWEIGAYEYVLSAVTDLTSLGASQNSVTVAWTVPGEDRVTAEPTSYDIRYSDSPILEANWGGATQVSGEPVAAGFGDEQSFTITGLSPGQTHYVAMKVLDEAGHSSVLSNVVSEITASSGNHAPLLAPIGDKSVVADETLTFIVSATDADSDPLTYSVTDLPTGATFNPATRTFAWTPTSGQSGTYHVTFVVTDGQVTVTETITIVANNRAPVLAPIGDKNAVEKSLLSFSVSATDEDGDSLTYSATGLPAGAGFAYQTFNWTPGIDQAGTYQVAFQVTDGLATDSETITITVTQVFNRAPVLAPIGNKSVNENASLNFSVSATDQDGDALTYSATGLPTGANFIGQTFSWAPTYAQAGSYTVTFSVTDGELNDSESVTITVVDGEDQTPPAAADFAPLADAIQVPRNSLVALTISDAGLGVDANTVTLQVSGQVVYAGDSVAYQSAGGVCTRKGTAASYRYTYQPINDFDFDEEVTVRVTASDLAHNAMTPVTYRFRTEMRAFGDNHTVSWGPLGLDKSAPATVSDSAGQIWVVYQAGPVGQRDIYVSKMAADAGSFDGPAQLTTDPGDQSCPDIAVGADDTLYVVWQDDRRGNWDIYARTSADGVTWSAQTRVTDSNDNQTAPAIVVDALSPNRAHLAYEDNSAGHADIYVATSSDGFATTTVARVTSNASDQTAPAIAADASNTVYVVWTDGRNGSDDIYAAASNLGPWTNTPVVTGAGNQSLPDIATEQGGSVLHFVWVDDLAGDKEVRYASSDGMPSSPLTSVSIVDDTSYADQTTPALIVTGSAGTGLKVFTCWQDFRNVDSNGRDTDLYFVEIRTGDETNVLIGDGGTSSNQSEPAIGVDAYGQPYVVWADDRNLHREIYHAGSTFADPDPMASHPLIALLGGTAGTTPAADSGDVSVTFPPGASPTDVTVTIREILNPQRPVTSSHILAYDFGPSGLQFSPPVTITIPYAIADYPSGSPEPCWYDALAGTFSQDGIADIQTLHLSSTIDAVRFSTTHFTPYILLDGLPDGGDADGIVDGGGGGCALSPAGSTSAVEFILPYAGLAAAMVALRWRDRRVRGV